MLNFGADGRLLECETPTTLERRLDDILLIMPPPSADGRGRDGCYQPPPAQIPACGFPAPGSCLRWNAIGLRGIGYPCSYDPWARGFGDRSDPALCPGPASQLALPSTGRRPSTVSAADATRHCSRLHRYHAAVRLLTHVHAHRSACRLHGPIRCAGRMRVRSPRFRRRTSPHAWGLRPREAPRRQAISAGGYCLLFNCTRSAPRNSTRFAARCPACGIPCERFELSLAASPRITRGRGGWLFLTP